MIRRLVFVLLCLLAYAASVSAQDLPAGVCATLRQERGGGALSEHEIGAILNRVAWAHRSQGVGLSRKASGNHCASPAGPIACDILQLADGTAWDVLSDVENTASVHCGGSIGRLSDPNRPFVAPAEPHPAPRPEPQPEPQPAPPPSGAATVELQQQQLAALVQIIQQLQAQNAALAQGLAEIKAAIAAGVKIRF